MVHTPHTPQASALHTPHTPRMEAPHTPHSPVGGFSSPHSPHHEEHERQNKLDEEYCRQQRSAAEAVYQRRHQIMDEQKHAWDAGDKGRAKKLSEEAKALGEEAVRLEQSAAEKIFQYKNSRQPPDYIDLHGLHVEEALHFVKLRIQTVREQNKPILIVIYGAGHHSVNNKQLIKPAVMEYLSKEKDLTLHEDYDEIIGHSNPGCVTVKYNGSVGRSSRRSSTVSAGSGASLDLRSPVSTTSNPKNESGGSRKPTPKISHPPVFPVPPKEDSWANCCIIM